MLADGLTTQQVAQRLEFVSDSAFIGFTGARPTRYPLKCISGSVVDKF